jgi:hypothetical protein
MSESKAAVLVAVLGALLLTGSAALSSSGIRAYGEDAILKRISEEDNALCAQFGIAASSQSFAQCMADLADLRQRHVQLLKEYEWL